MIDYQPVLRVYVVAGGGIVILISTLLYYLYRHIVILIVILLLFKQSSCEAGNSPCSNNGDCTPDYQGKPCSELWCQKYWCLVGINKPRVLKCL